ncbi:probable DNA helicase MCM8 [Tanacetum coccineum]
MVTSLTLFMIAIEYTIGFDMQVLYSNSNGKWDESAKVNIRLHNYPISMIALKNLKAAYIGKGKGKNQGLYYLYLEGILVKNSKSQSVSETLQNTEPAAKATDLLDLYSFSQRDLEFVSKFSLEHGPDVFPGITLALFGGVRKHSIDQNKVPVRGDIHAIIVGMRFSNGPFGLLPEITKGFGIDIRCNGNGSTRKVEDTNNEGDPVMPMTQI